jgi:tetratricopeptide (TPR) repeat protein
MLLLCDCYDRALDSFDKALKFAPEEWPYRSVVLGNRAAVNFMLERYPESIEDCDAALQLDAKLYRLLVRKGKAQLRLGDMNAADECLNSVLKLDSASVDGHKELESTKTEARTLIKTIAAVRLSVKNMAQFEAGDDYRTIIKMTEEILQTMPASRAIHVFRAKAYVKQGSYSLAKCYMEGLLTSLCPSVLGLHAHAQAQLNPIVNVNNLVVKESSKASLQFDSAAIMNAILCLGSELGRLYIACLKNADDCRSCTGELMDKVGQLLFDLSTIMSPTDPYARPSGSKLGTTNSAFSEWTSWVPAECARVKELIAHKNAGDRNYRSGNYAAATADYLRAIQVDKESPRWCAILYTNRAAALMSQALYTEAIADCHSATVKDPCHFKAYLRRARAHAV